MQRWTKSIKENKDYNNLLKISGDHVLSREQLRNKRILITGASGMIGSCLVDLLLFWNGLYNLSVCVYAAGRNPGRLADRFANAGSEEQLQYVFYEMGEKCNFDFDVDYIIHAAGDASPRAFMENPAITVRNTVESTYQLILYGQKCGAERFLYISSGEVYGQAQAGMCEFQEEYQGYVELLQARSCYPISKRAAENICAGWSCSQEGLETVIARPCHIYGPTALANDDRVASVFLRKVLSGENIILKSPGEQVRSWCFVCDCVSALMIILLEGENGRAYNIAEPQSRASVRAFAELIARQSGRQVKFDIPSEKEKQIFNPMDMAVLAADKTERLGWKAAFSLESGIQHSLQLGLK